MTCERLYSLLIRAYPASFRKRYGREIIQTMADARRTSPLTGFRFWCFLVADTSRAATEQYVDIWKRGSRQTVKWVAACIAGAVAWKAIGTGLGWGFAYFYHPYLEGSELSPWVYGAMLGAGLGIAQCLVLRQLPRATWILVSATCAAAGLEFAVVADGWTGPLGFGVIVGIAVACGQWLVLRDSRQGAGWLPTAGASMLSIAAVSLAVVVNRAPAAMTALNHYVIPGNHWPTPMAHQLYAPSNLNEWTVGLVAIAVSGLVVGAMTARPVSTLLSDAR